MKVRSTKEERKTKTWVPSPYIRRQYRQKIVEYKKYLESKNLIRKNGSFYNSRSKFKICADLDCATFEHQDKLARCALCGDYYHTFCWVRLNYISDQILWFNFQKRKCIVTCARTNTTRLLKKWKKRRKNSQSADPESRATSVAFMADNSWSVPTAIATSTNNALSRIKNGMWVCFFVQIVRRKWMNQFLSTFAISMNRRVKLWRKVSHRPLCFPSY